MSAPLYRSLFGFKKEPFAADLRREEILQTSALDELAQRFDYVVRLGAVGLVTGEVGSGKSTALRWAAGAMHPSEYRVLWLTASGGSILETYRQLSASLEVETRSFSRALLTRIIRAQILALVAQKIHPVLIIDEASLLRLDVLTELHTICQFEGDSRPLLPLILAGQNNLVEHLQFRACQPLGSRIVARSHLDGISRDQMQQYLAHHLKIAGVSANLFSEPAVTAIHQGSGGLLRRANNLARGSLVAAAAEKCHQVAAEHVRLATSELM